MRPIPVVFHVGPIQIHTYGIGLALTFWFGYRYFARRLRARGYRDDWVGGTFLWILVSAIVGARLFHVVANLGYYESAPRQILAIWNGGLSSFGGLAFAIPVGIVSARRRCPELPTLVACDIISPVLAAAWAIGRLLGPQLMVAGGGKPTTAWFGMYYAGQVGRRLPVPIFQALECGVVYLVALYVESRVKDLRGNAGIVTAVTVSLWSLSRFFDEYLWLGSDNGTDPIEIVSLVLFAGGLTFAGFRFRRARRLTAAQPSEPPPLPVDAVPSP